MTSRFSSVGLAMASATLLALASAHASAQAQDARPTSSDTAIHRATGDGSLDPSFGNGGLAQTDAPERFHFPKAMAIQPDGKILVVGHISNPPDDPFGNCRLTRFLANGALDRDFGIDGSVRTGAIGDYANCNTLAVLGDGKIVIAGHTTKTTLVMRYQANGARDLSFSDDGVQTTSFLDLGFPEPKVWDMAIQADGKIVVAGYAFDWRGDLPRNQFMLARYRQDGQLDEGFGDGGRILTSFADYSSSDARGNDLVIQADGRIVVTGALGGTGVYATAMARYLPDGRLDPEFGEQGRLASLVPGMHRGSLDLALQADGKLIMARGLTGHGEHCAVMRYFADGRVDPSFRREVFDGVITALAIQADGRILVAGQSDFGDPNHPDNPRGHLIRLNPDGSIDESFQLEPFRFGGKNEFFHGVATQHDGRVVLMADSKKADNSFDIGVARLRTSTYCIADLFNPGRYLGFSDSGWFATSNRDRSGAGFGLVGQGRTFAIAGRDSQLHLLKASIPGSASTVAVNGAAFTRDARLGWGLAQVAAAGTPRANYAVLDPAINDSACRVRPGR